MLTLTLEPRHAYRLLLTLTLTLTLALTLTYNLSAGCYQARLPQARRVPSLGGRGAGIGRNVANSSAVSNKFYQNN